MSLQIRRRRAHLSTLALVAALGAGAGAEPGPAPIPQHPLVTAAEALYQRGLPQACGELMKQAAMALGLTDDDLVHLQFLTALRALDDGDELAAHRALAHALRLDPSAAPPSFALKLSTMVQEARMKLSGSLPSDDRNARLAVARKTAGEREPAHAVLLRAVDALYKDLQIDAAAIVLDLVRASTAPVRAQVALRRGVLRLEAADEEGARAAFKEALEADRGTTLPGYAPPKTLRLFEEVRGALRAPAVGAAPPVASAAPPEGNILSGSRGWGVLVGGAGLVFVAGGAVAGAVALTSVQAQERASVTGDYPTYLRNHDTAVAAINVADGLYVAGAIALGVGAVLFFRMEGGVSTGAAVGPGRASITVGGRF